MPDRDRPRLVRVAGRDTWHIYHQRRRFSTGCTDRAEAEIVLARYLRDHDRPAATAGISGILQAYLDDRREAAIPGLARLEWAHKPLMAYFAAKPAEIIDGKECRSYAARRKRDGVAPATIRTELQALRAALGWAVTAKIIPSAPPIWMPPRPPARDRWLTREEADRLLAGAKAPHVRLFIAIGLHTGARAGAILGLPWARVDLEGRRIDFRDPAKAATRKGRAIVPINDTLLPELMRAKEAATTEWVIEWAGERVASVKRAFREAAGRAKLKGVTPHVLRHTAATWMAQAGVPMWQIAGFLGHSSPAMVEQTYGHHHPDHLRDAAKALG